MQSVLHNLCVRVFVACVIQHGVRMRHIVICGLLGSNSIYPLRLINDTIFGGKKSY